MRLVIARCSVDYVGRLSARLDEATRLIMVKGDGTVLIHSETSHRPLNWMTAPCTLVVEAGAKKGRKREPDVWVVTNKGGEQLRITMFELVHDSGHELGIDPGLVKEGVEAQLQELLAAQVEVLGEGWSLVRREYPTAIGPVDLMCRNADGASVAVEIKRRGEIDGVEQLTRYLELLNRDPLLAPVTGVYAAQEIKPQARTLAEDRGIRCVVLDYDALRGVDHSDTRLF